MSGGQSKEVQTLEVPKWLLLLVAIATGVAIVMLCLYMYKFGFSLASSQDIWGQFGDYVGGVLNPLFSIVALFSLLYTIHIQSREMRESTAQLEQSASALKKQNLYLDRQQFDANFFQLMSMRKNRIEKLGRITKTKDGYVTGFQGDACLLDSWQKLRDLIDNPEAFDPMRMYQYSGVAFAQWNKDEDECVDAFLNSTFNVIEFVYRANVNFEAKKFACDVIKKQISNAEYFLLLFGVAFYNRFSWFSLEAIENDFFDMLVYGVKYVPKGMCAIHLNDKIYHQVLLEKSRNLDYVGFKI
jgi:uncharacterized membrane protein